MRDVAGVLAEVLGVEGPLGAVRRIVPEFWHKNRAYLHMEKVYQYVKKVGDEGLVLEIEDFLSHINSTSKTENLGIDEVMA